MAERWSIFLLSKTLRKSNDNKTNIFQGVSDNMYNTATDKIDSYGKVAIVFFFFVRQILFLNELFISNAVCKDRRSRKAKSNKEDRTIAIEITANGFAYIKFTYI